MSKESRLFSLPKSCGIINKALDKLQFLFFMIYSSFQKYLTPHKKGIRLGLTQKPMVIVSTIYCIG